MFSVNITNTLPAGLKAEIDRLELDSVRIASDAVAETVKENFATLAQTRPNKKGWPSQGTYEAMRRSVSLPKIFFGVARIFVNHLAARQRLEGGVIRPTRGQYLTIPAVPEAYGHRAREFFDLKFGFASDPENPGTVRPALVQRQQTQVRLGKTKKDGTRTVFQDRSILQNDLAPEQNTAIFWLIRQAVQPPDPTILPTEEQMTATGTAALQSAVNNRESRP